MPFLLLFLLQDQSSARRTKIPKIHSQPISVKFDGKSREVVGWKMCAWLEERQKQIFVRQRTFVDVVRVLKHGARLVEKVEILRLQSQFEWGF